jgi:hypothetical protein
MFAGFEPVVLVPTSMGELDTNAGGNAHAMTSSLLYICTTGLDFCRERRAHRYTADPTQCHVLSVQPRMAPLQCSQTFPLHIPPPRFRPEAHTVLQVFFKGVSQVVFLFVCALEGAQQPGGAR